VRVQILGLSVLLVLVVLIFAAIFFWALVIQPRAERAAAELAPADVWRFSGFSQFGERNFTLLQVVPTPRMDLAEYRIQDESGRELGSYTGNRRKSGAFEYGGKKASLYIQGAPFGGSAYAGKVGGSSDRSIVIRDENRLIAEVWRVRVFPVAYRLAYGGETLQITAGIWPTRPGNIMRAGELVGVFRRPAVSSRNLFLACRGDLPDELKVYLCGICLLQ
jgi:hypothetical protein